MARILNTTQIASSRDFGGKIWSVKSNDVLMNGYIGVVGALKQGESEIRNFSKVTDITTPVRLGIISNPEVIPTNCTNCMRLDERLENFIIPPDTATRALDFDKNDAFEISIDSIKALANDLPVVGNKVVLKANSFEFEEKAAAAGTEAFVMEIESIFEKDKFFQTSELFVNKPVKMARLRIVKYVYQ